MLRNKWTNIILSLFAIPVASDIDKGESVSLIPKFLAHLSSTSAYVVCLQLC